MTRKNLGHSHYCKKYFLLLLVTCEIGYYFCCVISIMKCERLIYFFLVKLRFIKLIECTTGGGNVNMHIKIIIEGERRLESNLEVLTAVRGKKVPL